MGIVITVTMDKMVNLVKYFIKVCNKKDWSHLSDIREDGWGDVWSMRSEEWTELRREQIMRGVVREEWIDRSNNETDIPSENESEPVDIHNFKPKNKSRCAKFTTKDRSIEEDDSEEEFSSTEENNKVAKQRRKKKSKKILRKSHRKEQLLFVIDM